MVAQQQGVPLELIGTLHIVYGRPQQRRQEVAPRYFLGIDQGEMLELDIPDALLRTANGVKTFTNERVRITGLQAQGAMVITVESLTLLTPEQHTRALMGSSAWATILCRFANLSDVTPETPTWFDTLMGSAYPGMDHYWREVSYDYINLEGSKVFGWYNLPNTRDAYLDDLAALLRDCTSVADDDVDFRNYQGINLMFNDSIGCCAWGGGGNVTADGVTQSYHVTWMPPWGFRNQDVLGQEMGHGFGLPHSSGPYSTPYDSAWDVMSQGGTCSSPHSEYGCIGVHTIAYHKDLLGWIPPSRKRTINTPGSTTLNVLRRLSQPTPSGYLMAQIPIVGLPDPVFYTIEARRFAGYDNDVPGEAVIIHRVDPTRPDRNAQVVDEDGNGDPNDLGAMWHPGFPSSETFSDTVNDISVRVNPVFVLPGAIPASFSVTITVGGRTLQVSKLETSGTGSIMSNPSGINCGSSCNESFVKNLKVSLTAIPDAQSRLKKWSGCDSTSGNLCSVTMSDNQSVTAEFTCLYESCYSSCLTTCVPESGHSVCVPACRDECEICR